MYIPLDDNNNEEEPRWVGDQRRFDETGDEPDWRSSNPLVPSQYRLDLEFNCYTNSENLADADPCLTYVEGLCRIVDCEDDSWGEHAWCVTVQGEIVDPYFEWKFPGRQLEYKEVWRDKRKEDY